MMELGVGAVSRRVVEEAAKLKVAQIVASRRQVNSAGGYIGWTQQDLADVVHDLSEGSTKVIRDHGGPLQGGTKDDGTDELNQDIDAGFDGIHIDVSALPRADQLNTLRNLLITYVNRIDHIEVGGEHDEQSWNDRIFELALPYRPTFMVVTTGTYAWADKQYGVLRTWKEIKRVVDTIHSYGVRAKAHNMDDIGDRVLRYGKILDMYNLAPELGKVEVRAILTVMSGRKARELLTYAYDSQKWTRWFNADEGTYQERAECAIRYLLQCDPKVRDLTSLNDDNERYVRKVISDAVAKG